jgi:cobalt-zinc-cadmium efflux system membrane fusion protein
MTPIQDMMCKRWSLVPALGLVLAWGMTAATSVRAVDDGHEDHGHDEPADQEDHGAHPEEEHVEGAEKALGEEDAHSEHGDEEEGLRLTPEQRKRFGIVVRPAGPGSLRNEVSLPGEIVFNQDRVVHIVPRVAGIARDVFKSVGDAVEADEVLAVIESRELADAKSEYLAATAREALAVKVFTREESLRAKQVSSEQDYLEAEQALAEARIQLRSAEQKLHALGLPERVVQGLDAEHDEAITRYEIRSPIAGIVTEKHVSLGESLDADADIFTVVDMNSVWVNLTVYTKNLGAVRPQQDVTLRVDHSGAQARGNVSMVTPFAEESTRSATARVVLDNRDGAWMPGTFVTGFINTSEANLPVVAPKHAVQNIEGRDVVFVEHEGTFEMNPVTVGRADRTHVEILAGLEPGTPYVAEGAFQLKATVITSALGSHAGHGH